MYGLHQHATSVLSLSSLIYLSLSISLSLSLSPFMLCCLASLPTHVRCLHPTLERTNLDEGPVIFCFNDYYRASCERSASLANDKVPKCRDTSCTNGMLCA
jgi:hypothetical protein